MVWGGKGENITPIWQGFHVPLFWILNNLNFSASNCWLIRHLQPLRTQGRIGSGHSPRPALEESLNSETTVMHLTNIYLQLGEPPKNETPQQHFVTWNLLHHKKHRTQRLSTWTMLNGEKKHQFLREELQK